MQSMKTTFQTVLCFFFLIIINMNDTSPDSQEASAVHQLCYVQLGLWGLNPTPFNYK